MSKGTARHFERLAEWRARFSRWQASGLTVEEFCRRDRVTASTFYYWRQRVGVADDTARSSRGFVPVEIVDDRPHMTSGVACEFMIGELVCRVPRDADDELLRRLVRVLREERRPC